MSMKESMTKRIVHMPVKPNLSQTLKVTACNTKYERKTGVDNANVMPIYIEADPVLKRHLALA